jgi:hypothetical protein
MIPRAGAPKPFKYGNEWQYHSRSDHHSKVACWGMLFDLLVHCPLLRDHAQRQLVGFGLNHELRNFRSGSKKNLDLVVCRPRSEPDASAARRRTFEQRGGEIGAVLSDDAKGALRSLPTFREFPVGAVHIAVEAKACMTAFGKARPRLFDELNSSHQVVHGNSDHTIAAGHAVVNCADEFISPGLNNFPLRERDPVVSKHRQPRDAASVIEKLTEIPRRAREGEEGFDALAITVIRCRNDGSRVELVDRAPAPQPGEIHHYEWTIHRLAQLYEQKYRGIS